MKANVRDATKRTFLVPDGKGNTTLWSYTGRPQSEPVFDSKLRRLTEDFSFTNEDTGYVKTVKAGFEWDGASIPRWYWWRFQPHDPKVEIPSLDHDEEYTHHKGERHNADRRFKGLLISEANGQWKSNVMYQAVNHFGGGPWNKGLEETEAKKRWFNKLWPWSKKEL